MNSIFLQEVCIQTANTSDAYTTFNNQYTGGLGSKTTSNFGHNNYSSGHVDAIRNDDLILET